MAAVGTEAKRGQGGIIKEDTGCTSFMIQVCREREGERKKEESWVRQVIFMFVNCKLLIDWTKKGRCSWGIYYIFIKGFANGNTPRGIL